MLSTEQISMLLGHGKLAQETLNRLAFESQIKRINCKTFRSCGDVKQAIRDYMIQNSPCTARQAHEALKTPIKYIQNTCSELEREGILIIVGRNVTRFSRERVYQVKAEALA